MKGINLPEELKAASFSDLFPVPFQLGAQCWQGEIVSRYLLHTYTQQGKAAASCMRRHRVL